jgi:hypothetical protein
VPYTLSTTTTAGAASLLARGTPLLSVARSHARTLRLHVTLSQRNRQWVRDYLPDFERGGEVDLSRVRADGDADLADADFAGFVVPGCSNCSGGDGGGGGGGWRSTGAAGGGGGGGAAAAAAGALQQGGGTIKPDVVFFGGNMDRAVRDAARAAVERSSGLLLLGTSAQVFSACVRDLFSFLDVCDECFYCLLQQQQQQYWQYVRSTDHEY